MAGQLLDGKAIAKKVRAEVKQRAEAFFEAHGRKPGLHVVLVGEDPASQVYVRNKERAAGKAGLDGHVHRLPADTTQADLEALVAKLNADPAIDGILVQLPLPEQLEAQPVLDLIDPSKDVDGLTPMSAGLLMDGRPGLRPCTPSGCMRMLEETGVELEGKRALVVGRSLLVGKPVALMLLAKNATVTMAHSRTKELAARVAEADVVVAAVGRAELVKGEWVKEGAVVLDVGINRNEEGKLIGDVEFAAAKERASWITPVPGGVGPMTIAMLLANTVTAAERREAGKD
ncbi:MAG TPA: bifunctional methylenetetrahydrofolate dehydrogenase/methenyltetrahydrofolate cyclohydrolase FolD [Polyangiaceae bacterium LLY-WYZ-15_(1-7)]|nr:bifunctional methylenetetrahydrofolate dehydrogenase/methenyltetrahydrofolate cyclohydrolase FolD [Sandaracinus sp.]HJK93778.1 bifunctional methylenetetrahydrofolate dehydrogenase/methenyltetrahydrofolate cyclohydrolase FolD [Polyangiaceae bacterium LLY-WYZ-15_(1-7)]MBJ72955.1 bifunctional methylenetetrahydrofolate dehydrogenase/methenyltetrahydrofolate cyclohydrolase FolD [Sandaracinus sp.]HJL06277.1 bifunctional methylenetetrahydrofolate dehydrogenase/methenyltetrahydrofolate cyclohydrolase